MQCLVNPSSEKIRQWKKSISETQGAEETTWLRSWRLYLRTPSFHFGFFWAGEFYINIVWNKGKRKKEQEDGRGAPIAALTLQTATEHVR